jgi:hypothetical protein
MAQLSHQYYELNHFQIRLQFWAEMSTPSLISQYFIMGAHGPTNTLS